MLISSVFIVFGFFGTILNKGIKYILTNNFKGLHGELISADIQMLIIVSYMFFALCLLFGSRKIDELDKQSMKIKVYLADSLFCLLVFQKVVLEQSHYAWALGVSTALLNTLESLISVALLIDIINYCAKIHNFNKNLLDVSSQDIPEKFIRDMVKIIKPDYNYFRLKKVGNSELIDRKMYDRVQDIFIACRLRSNTKF